MTSALSIKHLSSKAIHVEDFSNMCLRLFVMGNTNSSKGFPGNLRKERCKKKPLPRK